MATSNTPVVFQDDIITRPGARKARAILRILVGFYFLWAFTDKMFGLGFSTPSERSVLHGGRPAQGFIKAVPQGQPLESFFSLFVNPVGDWLFLLGLLGLGLALILGMGVKVAGVAGPLLMALMWLAELPPIHSGEASNPLIDDHWFLALIFVVVMLTRAGDTWGLGRWWASKVGDSWLR
ncbi:MAG: DoxX family protein [Actinomyces urogenitalis]|uniref:DoxX family protein n=1 Tax=Actinomyces urogenitalis TaxID=103621 RepID=A0A2I1KRG5_9ACTO|nr:DoxX family protein [Actinomyces urogenitalis]MDU0972553.1 DoxX family protein [Actinomyces urogenitalis]MDU6151767.1 DoxX family protein [Actinomyces urogenitalis]PKY98216.1 DoxX family protein [Actinomyces urogenitalis]